MASDEVLIQTAISSWEQVIKRVGTLCLSCSEEQLLIEVAPGKNRISYLWGHLTAVNDAMFSVLRLEIFWMVCSGAKVRGDYIFHGEPGIVEHCLVRIERVALRVQDDNGLR